jgi:hypothetical protein
MKFFPLHYQNVHAGALLATVVLAVVLEMFGVFSPKLTTISRFVISHTPWWVRAGFCLWLFWHWVLEK